MNYDLIIINPGHGGRDSGAVSGGVKEKDNVLRRGLVLRDLLVGRGCKVAMTREDDRFHSLGEIARIANRLGTRDSLFISLHENAFSKTSANGMENFVHPSSSEKTRRLASAIAVETVKAVPVLGPLRTGASQHPGVKARALSVLHNTEMAGILVETGFLSNPPEREVLADASLDEVIAGVIAAAVCHGELMGVETVAELPDEHEEYFDPQELILDLQRAEYQVEKALKRLT